MSWLSRIIEKQSQWDPEPESRGVADWLLHLPSNAFKTVRDFTRGVGLGWRYSKLPLKEIEEMFLTPHEWVAQHPGSNFSDYRRWKTNIKPKEKELNNILPRYYVNRWRRQTQNRMLKDLFRRDK